MADQADEVFAQTPEQPKQETPATPQADPFADKLMEIKNEDGAPKYDSVEKALEALKASQQFIETLKSEKNQTVEELQKARAELEKMGSIDDFVKRVAPPTQTTQKEQPETPKPSEGLSEEKIREMLDKELAARETKTTQSSNLNKVVSKLSELYGEKASAHVAARAKELNTTPEALRDLARTNPDLVLATLGTGEKKKDAPAPSRSTQFVEQNPKDNNPVPKWEKGAARGGFTNSQLRERWNEVGNYTKKRLGVES